MMKQIDMAWNQGLLSDIAFHFGALMSRLEPNATQELVLAATLVTENSVLGKTCLDLNQVADTLIFGEIKNVSFMAPSINDWLVALQQSSLVGPYEMERPLVLEDDNRLYLYRYRDLEKRLAASIKNRCEMEDFLIDINQINHVLSQIFPHNDDDPEQREAAIQAIRKPLTIITGRPGTGKTSTAVYILALLKALDLVEPGRIALSAPTGKAAMRLRESVRGVSSNILGEGDWMSIEAMTLHRLLGHQRNSARSFYGSHRQVPYDVVVIDEASMGSLSLITHLFESLMPTCRLILLGDHNQLSSVGAGTVFKDICDTARFKPLSDSLIELEKSWRFSKASHIGRFATAVTNSDAKTVLQILADHTQSEVTFREYKSAEELEKLIEQRCLNSFSDRIDMAIRCASPPEMFEAFSEIQLLGVQRRGIGGVDSLNQIVTRQLFLRGLIPKNESFYPGQPILITENNYDLGLFNGDIGVVLKDANNGFLQTIFPGTDTSWFPIKNELLPPYEQMYAMTVHKSQGSEFARVIIVLPLASSPVLSRELLYTAITRATRHVEIWGSKPHLCSVTDLDSIDQSHYQNHLFN